MARGAPDYSNVKSEQAIYTLLDLGELAARLGSIDIFERSGNLVWMDDFEGAVLRWGQYVDGTLAAVSLSTAYQLSGIQSCMLTAGSDGAMSAQIYRYLTIPNLSAYSFELAFAAAADITSYTWYIDHNVSHVQHEYKVKFDSSTGELSYWNTAGGWTVFASGISILATQYMFNIGKLTVDLATGKYKRFRLNQTTYDMEGLIAAVWPLAVADYFEALFEVVGTPATNAKCYVDNALVKQNEP